MLESGCVLAKIKLRDARSAPHCDVCYDFNVPISNKYVRECLLGDYLMSTLAMSVRPSVRHL